MTAGEFKVPLGQEIGEIFFFRQYYNSIEFPASKESLIFGTVLLRRYYRGSWTVVIVSNSLRESTKISWRMRLFVEIESYEIFRS